MTPQDLADIRVLQGALELSTHLQVLDWPDDFLVRALALFLLGLEAVSTRPADLQIYEARQMVDRLLVLAKDYDQVHPEFHALLTKISTKGGSPA